MKKEQYKVGSVWPALYTNHWDWILEGRTPYIKYSSTSQQYLDSLIHPIAYYYLDDKKIDIEIIPVIQ